MPETTDWLSRLLELTPVHGHLELRCLLGAPWRIGLPPAEIGEMPYHVVLAGSALLEQPDGVPIRLESGDILLFSRGAAHVLHDGSGAPAKPARKHANRSVTISENGGSGERLDMLCGRFVLTATHERLLRSYLPEQLVVHAAGPTRPGADTATTRQLAGLVALMRMASDGEGLGGRAMLNALSTALFALTLRLASESSQAPAGLLAVAGNPRLAPALEALFRAPGHAWTLSALARLCNMSRATFVRLFQEKMGCSASHLLTDIRMTLAANQLQDPARSTGSVADAAGYQSEAAFQRAFKLHMGATPAQWRRAARTSGSTAPVQDGRPTPAGLLQANEMDG